MHFGARLAAMGRTESPAGTLRGLVKAGQLHTRPVAGSNLRRAPNIPHFLQHPKAAMLGAGAG